MEKDYLKKELDILRTELSSMQGDKSKVKEHLDRIIVDVEDHLCDNSSTKEEGLIERLQDIIEQNEAEHPKITEALNSILVSLSNIGI